MKGEGGLKMEKNKLFYTHKTSWRSRSIRISVKHTGEVVVTRPRWVKEEEVRRFVESKEKWIRGRQEYFKKLPKYLLRGTRKEFKERKEEARRLVKEKIEKFNKIYGFKVGKIAIRNQKTRWGSCSKNGNLNFNYKIVMLPEKLADYIVVHELCHLGEFNHSKRFWALVEGAIPEYKNIKKELKGGVNVAKATNITGDYVEAMWLMLQQPEPDDYVIATGETHSVQEFVEIAFATVGISDWQKYVVANKPEFMRPAEVDYLIGDYSKAKKTLGWTPKTSFKDLVQMMVKADVEMERRNNA
jgi:predicted metal-dependent hydrolase